MNSDPKPNTPPIPRIKAFLKAFQGHDIKYDPNEAGHNGANLDATISDIKTAVDVNRIPDDQVKLHLEQAKASYTESKAATEYQDQKVARLLTILAFLTAAAATIFAKFIDIYALDSSGRSIVDNVLIYLTYVGFGLYFLAIAAGALTTFYATQTRFVIPDEKNFRSLLFFKGIASATPGEWGSEFAASPKDISRKYIEHYVVEAYLIAIKTNIKVRYLGPAQKFLQLAIKILMCVLILLMAAFLLVSRDAKQDGGNGAQEPITSIQNVASHGQVMPQTVASQPNQPVTDVKPAVSSSSTPALAPLTQPTRTTAHPLPATEKTPDTP